MKGAGEFLRVKPFFGILNKTRSNTQETKGVGWHSTNLQSSEFVHPREEK
jgi:hypothetical protein